MSRLKILGISCNWAPYAGYNAAARSGIDLPANFHLVRVMCLGRLNQALILKAFESGADGVILLSCFDEDCRYGPGPEIGRTNVERVRQLLHLLGIGQERLVEQSFAPHDQEALAKALWSFQALIEAQGPNPAKPWQEREQS